MCPERCYLFKEGLSEKIKKVFLEDAKSKYERLNKILEQSLFAEERDYIFKIAHGYKANAGYMGQNELLQLASTLDSAFKAQKGDEELLTMTEELLMLLKKIIFDNS